MKTESPIKSVPSTPTGKKEANQWYDVGIIKGTSNIVSHYHLPAPEAGQGNGDVSSMLATWLAFLVVLKYIQLYVWLRLIPFCLEKGNCCIC